MDEILGLFRHAGNVERHPAGDIIFEEGSPGTCMYVLRSGRLDVTIGGRVVEIVEAGGMVGEMSLFDDEPHSATVSAHTDCEIVPVDRQRFLFMLRETPFFALAVMRTMARRLRSQTRPPATSPHQ
jgi:CRP/FNR family transcriptional regulator, cyclic AMP receptor protein